MCAWRSLLGGAKEVASKVAPGAAKRVYPKSSPAPASFFFEAEEETSMAQRVAQEEVPQDTYTQDTADQHRELGLGFAQDSPFGSSDVYGDKPEQDLVESLQQKDSGEYMDRLNRFNNLVGTEADKPQQSKEYLERTRAKMPTKRGIRGTDMPEDKRGTLSSVQAILLFSQARRDDVPASTLAQRFGLSTRTVEKLLDVHQAPLVWTDKDGQLTAAVQLPEYHTEDKGVVTLGEHVLQGVFLARGNEN